MTDRHQYVDMIKRKLDELDQEVDTLEIRLREAGNERQDRGRTARADLRETQRQLQGHMAELASTSDDAWQRVRLSLDSTWATLKAGLVAARNELLPPAKKGGQ